jgi:signal transduction histidine kinase
MRRRRLPSRDITPFRAVQPVLTFGAMKSIRRLPVRALLPIAVAAVAAVASLTFQMLPNPDPGIHLAYQDGEVVIESVDYGSSAQLQGLHPGFVVTWLGDHYVLGESAQAKRDIAQSQGTWTSIRTTVRDQVPAEDAAYAKLVAAARQSDIPWLSDPEANPAPSCYLDGSCAPSTTQVQPDGSVSAYPTYMYWVQSDLLCVPTDGSRLYVQNSLTLVLPGGTGYQGSTPDLSGEFCVSAASVQPGASPYGYIATSDIAYFQDWWAPISPGPGPTVLGLAILLLGWIIVGRGWAGSALKPYALTLPVATAVPLLVLSIDRYPSGPATLIGSLLVPLAMLPLAIDFLGRMDGRWRRLLVASIALGLALASAACGLLLPATPGLIVWRAFLAGGVAFVPGLFAARPLHRSESRSDSGLLGWRPLLARLAALVPGRFAGRLSLRLQSSSTTGSGQTPRALIESVDILLAAMTPGIAAICLTSPFRTDVWPLLLWLGGLLLATRVIVRPLGRLATVARLQRDLVVAATEAERMRIADIHDDALQDLTMLVRRLDAAGDTANAQAAREIAERLRGICGDLRLPVLDDLGVGPALEWLCGRLGSATEEISLDRLDGESRLPADVELAVFRVAQESLSNAVRHGSPPTVVRYRAREGWVELEVDDSGAGIAEGAAELAEQTGHLGLLTMTQRAEAVGARLSIRRRPGGGTRVSFVWERATVSAAVAVPAPA